MRITPWASKTRLRNPSKSMANLFFQKEIMSPKMSYFDSSRSVQGGAGCCRNRAESTRADVYLYPAGASGVAARKCNVAGVHTNSRRVEALRHLLEVHVKIRGWTITSNGWLFWSVVGRTFVSGSSPASRRRDVLGLIKQSFEPRRHYWRGSRSSISGSTSCSSGENST